MHTGKLEGKGEKVKTTFRKMRFILGYSPCMSRHIIRSVPGNGVIPQSLSESMKLTTTSKIPNGDVYQKEQKLDDKVKYSHEITN